MSNAACAQPANSNSSGKLIFHGSTPGDSLIKSALGINPGKNVDFIKWNVTLVNSAEQGDFLLTVIFGESQPNTQGFKNGGEKRSITGSFKTLVINEPGFRGEVIYLKSDQLPHEILLRKLNENLLHFTTVKHSLLIGNGGWSYTLNRVDKEVNTTPRFITDNAGGKLQTAGSDSVLFFQGRTNCYPVFMELHGIAPDDCNRVKWHIALRYDLESGVPTTFEIKSIGVGVADTRSVITGKWKIINGLFDEPNAIVYLLQPDPPKTKTALYLLKGDDNVLFFLDNNGNLLVGNELHSYTLNRK